MSNLVVAFPDAMLAVLNILRAAMPAIRFGSVQQHETTDKPTPYVMVRLDGSTVIYPVVETATIRVSVWHSTEADGLALGQRVRAVLCGYPGGSEVRSIAPLTGSIPTTDPDTGLPLSSFTVAVRLRPTSL
jgi:hypothetical protein